MGRHQARHVATRRLADYWAIFTVFDSKFFPALFNNVVLLVWLSLCSLIGILLAYLLDKNLHGSRVYQSIYYFPVVLSLAVVGFHLEERHVSRSRRACSTSGAANRSTSSATPEVVLVPHPVPRHTARLTKELRRAADRDGMATHRATSWCCISPA